jgi:ElaB/YqjD/DUF883 family membrane-anchored ribosome-binding protein
MLFSGYSEAKSAEVGEIERRLSSIERSLGRSRAMAAETTDHVGDAVASALTSIANRFLANVNSRSIRRGAKSVSDDAGRIATRSAKLGSDAMRRVGREVEHRPLVILAVAIGVGVLVGLLGRRR